MRHCSTLDKVEKVADNSRTAPQDIQQAESAIHALTWRQREILRLLQSGKGNKEIANQLGLSEGTVKQHLVAIFRRLNVRNRTMAAKLGILAEEASGSAWDERGGGALVGEGSVSEGRTLRYASAIQPVSVVLARMSSSETLVNRLGSEAFGRLNRLLRQACEQAARRFQGVIQATPGGYLILFGVPRLKEDDPERAASCACQVLQSMGEQALAESQASQGPLVRLCVATGEAVFTFDGGKITLHGEVLSPVCPGGVGGEDEEGEAPSLSAVSEAALARLGRHYGPLSPFVPAGALERRVMANQGASREERADSPFTGREAEWQALRQGAREARAGGSRSRVILGEAGFGKSRLVHELRSELLATGEWNWFESHCRAVSRHTPWHPFGALLEQWSGAAGVGMARQRAERILPWLEAHFPAHRSAARQMLAMLTGEAREEGDLEELASRVAALLWAILSTGKGPTVLFLDNLQWADPGTLAMFPHLSRLCQGGRVWLIGAARRTWERCSADTQCAALLPLSRMSPKETVRLLKAMDPSRALDKESLEFLSRWSGGVPQFAVELGRRALSRGVAAPLDPLELFPASLQGLVLERLDSVGVDWRICRAVAAHGRIAWSGLEALSVLPPAATLAAVEHLVKVGVLAQEGRGEGRILFFPNEMVRAAVWRALPEGDRAPRVEADGGRHL
ncbi:MAG: AAA family ATPase [Magnetococcales bacterium]|nr:AAA family ATPase [Magnetococcales bacterium]